MTRWLRLLLVLALFLPRVARAHPIDSATLILKEVVPGRFDLRFQSGSPSLQALAPSAAFPEPCRRGQRTLECGRTGLMGRIAAPWLLGTSTHLLVDIEWQDGRRTLRVLTANAPSFVVYGAPDSGWRGLTPILVDYGELGVEHILLGIDHLAFVLALAFLVRGRARLLATITAFTLAHSLTLAAATLGWVDVPAEPVEAMIALSIVLVCVECAKPGESLTRRSPWLVAFGFGLLHGLGFASALREVGLPEEHVPLALFGFNLGVELGQLGVVVVALAIGRVFQRMTLGSRPASLLPRVVVYAFGAVAAFWSIERVLATFTG